MAKNKDQTEALLKELKELKAIAYDLIAAKDEVEKRLIQTNQQIGEKTQELRKQEVKA